MAEPVARVAVANLTDYTWEIAVRATPTGEARSERVTPRSIAQLDLAGGDYVIEQKLVGSEASADSVRRFPARFVAGQDYKWSLATLRSQDANVAAPSAL